MNSKGIGVFHGATHPSVALAEIRPPVGSQVRVGRSEITRSVMPDGEASEYLVTQAVADYLETREPRALDGFIYLSAPQNGKIKRNVVLVHKAARVADLRLPRRTKISAHVYEHDEDGARPD